MSLLKQILEVLQGLIDPFIFMWLSASWLPQTVTTLLRNGQAGVLLSPSKFKEAWFGNFWGWAGPNVKLGRESHVIALLEGRTDGGEITGKATGPGIEGVCIEVGAGPGFWVDIFSNKHLEGSETRGCSRKSISRVYGVEPNRDHHVSLRQNIAKAGLEDVYEIVPAGIEDLDNPSAWGGKVEKGSVDCIVSILCLCSIPDPQHNLKELYSHLKPGGRWYIFEHVRADRNWGIRIYQAFVNLFWPHFLGGCQLCRPTEQWLNEAGPWEKIVVGQPSDEPWFQVVPHVFGVYTK